MNLEFYVEHDHDLLFFLKPGNRKVLSGIENLIFLRIILEIRDCL